MALMLHCYVLTFEFAKIAMQNVRKAKANFASNEGAQSNFKWLYCIVILLLCRAPIEHREYASMSIAQLPPPFLFVHWGCRKILRRREYSRWNMARASLTLVNNCWEGSLYLLLCFFFASFCVLLQIIFFLHFYLKSEKHLTLFFKDISSDKKRSSYLLKVLSVTRKRYMG